MVVQAEPWVLIKDGDPVARAMFSRHYSYRKSRDQMSLFWQKERNNSLFVGPGEKMVLITRDSKALFAWRKFKSMDDQEGVGCMVFRNEGTLAGRSSDLIRAANALAWKRWPGTRLFTYVHPKKVKSNNPGYCFIAAGYKRCGVTRKGLLIFECLPVQAGPEKIAIVG